MPQTSGGSHNNQPSHQDSPDGSAFLFSTIISIPSDFRTCKDVCWMRLLQVCRVVVAAAFLFLFSGAGLQAQSTKILDEATQMPLPNVVVSSGAITLQSGEDGTVQKSAFNSTGHNITVSRIGYQAQTFKKLPDVIFLLPMPMALDSVIISGSKFRETVKDIAQPVQIISAQRLAEINAPTVAEALAATANVTVQKSQLGGGSPVMRGFEANKILLVMDGVRMNNAIYRGGHLQNVITLDAGSLSRIEALYGPGAVVYGSDALGGVLHFHTRNPILSSTPGEIKVFGDAFARHSTAYTEFTGHTGFGISGAKLGSYTSITASKFGDLRVGNNNRPADYPNFGKRLLNQDRINGADSSVPNPDPNIQAGSGYSQLDLIQKFLFSPTKTIRHSLNLQMSTSTDVPRFDRLSEIRNGNLRFAEWYYGPQNRYMASYSLEFSRSRKLYDAARLQISGQHIDETRVSRQFGRDHRVTQDENVNVGQLTIDFEKEYKPGRELRYGLDGQMNFVQSSASSFNIMTGETASADTRYPLDGSQMHFGAIYVLHNWEFSKQFILNAGARYTATTLHADFGDSNSSFNFPFQNAEQTFSAPSGNLGAVWKPSKSITLRPNIGTAFRAPNVDDLSKVFESTGGILVIPNTEIQPEYSTTAELSGTFTLADHLLISASGFYTRATNLLTLQPDKYEGQDSIFYNNSQSRVFSTQNSADAYIAGGNASAEWQLRKGLTLSSTINYTVGKQLTDSTKLPLDHIAPLFGRTNLEYKTGKWMAEAWAAYNAPKKLADYSSSGEDNLQYATPDGMPGWFTLNLRGSCRVTDNLRLQAAIENILDQHYRTFASGISAPGRNLIITLRARF